MTIRLQSRNSSYSHSPTPVRSMPPMRTTPLLKPTSLMKPRTTPAWFVHWSAPLLLFAAGVSALGYCGYVVLDARYSQNAQSRQFDQALLAAHSAASADLTEHSAGVTDLAATAPLMPVFVEADGVLKTDGAALKNSAAIPAENFPLGRIEIASLGLKAMIEEGTGRQTLQRGVGHILGTSLLGASGNIGLAGHRDTFFRKLRNIHEGDEITLTTLAGSFLYRVDQISIVEPQESEVLRDSGENLLTLVTCYPFSFVGPSPKRFIVRARQVPAASSPTATTAIQ
jgi:sortase A